MYNKFNLFFFSYFFIIVSSFNYLLLLCIGLYSPFQLCKIKIIYCKWIERGYKYIFYVKSSNCTILNVSAVIYICNYVHVQFGNKLSIYLSIPGGGTPDPHRVGGVTGPKMSWGIWRVKSRI